MTVVEGVYIFLNVVSDCSRYIRVFKLLIYPDIRAYTAVLLKALCVRNFLLLKVPSCLIAVAIYRVSVEFSFKSLQDF